MNVVEDHESAAHHPEPTGRRSWTPLLVVLVVIALGPWISDLAIATSLLLTSLTAVLAFVSRALGSPLPLTLREAG
jgi:hypothetical protein